METAQLKKLARGIARALSDDEARADLRGSIRAAPGRQGKVIVKEYLATRAGQALLQRAANAAGGTAAELASTVADFPPFVIYLPVRSHRDRWDGGKNVYVIAALNSDDGPFYGFDLNGRPVDLASIDTATATVLALYPADGEALERATSGNTAKHQYVSGRSPVGTGFFAAVGPNDPTTNIVAPVIHDALRGPIERS